MERSLRAAALWDEVHDRLHECALGLSGGQQQRLCIARAIAVEPDVLLMDEPCSALDPIATARIEELMLELKNSYTIVIVTHNMQQAARVCGLHGLHAPGRAGGVRRDAGALHQSAGQAHRGLHHRALRLGGLMQRHFHEELDTLKQTLLAMGGLVEDQIRRVMRALRRARRRARPGGHRARPAGQPVRRRGGRDVRRAARPAPAGGGRPPLHHHRHEDRHRPGAASATRR